MLKHGDESSGRFKNEIEKNISWIEIVLNRFPIDIRRVWKQNPTIGEGSNRIGKSLNRHDSKSDERLEINLNHE